MYFPHTVLYTFPTVLTRRICLTIIILTSMFDSEVILQGRIRCWSLLGECRCSLPEVNWPWKVVEICLTQPIKFSEFISQEMYVDCKES